YRGEDKGYVPPCSTLLFGSIGLVGNTICFLVLYRTTAQSTQSFVQYLRSLACFDFFVLLIEFIQTINDLTMYTLNYSILAFRVSIVCKLYEYFKHVTILVSCWTIAVLTFDRLILVCDPFTSICPNLSRKICNSKRAKQIIFILILISMIINLPQLLYKEWTCRPKGYRHSAYASPRQIFTQQTPVLLIDDTNSNNELFNNNPDAAEQFQRLNEIILEKNPSLVSYEQSSNWTSISDFAITSSISSFTTTTTTITTTTTPIIEIKVLNNNIQSDGLKQQQQCKCRIAPHLNRKTRSFVITWDTYVFHMFCYTLIPAIILIASNAAILHRLHQPRKIVGTQNEHLRSKLTRTLTMVSVIFLILYFPHAITQSAQYLVIVIHSKCNIKFILTLRILSRLCELLNTAALGMNFFFYILGVTVYRSAAIQMLHLDNFSVFEHLTCENKPSVSLQNRSIISRTSRQMDNLDGFIHLSSDKRWFGDIIARR
ncbi:unnamed protein product, partial [Didymodactylos carnosus]